MPEPSAAGESFRVGQILGERYEVRSRLGAGGMGEVWLATDLKLRIEVALKSVRPDFLANERLRELLRQEVLAAREVLSPNVCRVFDLEVADGMELVSMEYVSGRTLAELLKERTPLPLREARDIAAQFLAGLEAVHDAGLVHRDFKPENVMITRGGRVVVMDLGLAARPELVEGGIAGTPAYMSPEQARGGSLDARADVFAAGVVLAEMIAPAGIRDREKRLTLWEGLRSDPPRIPEGPWTPVIRKALSAEVSGRYGSARELSRELDGLTLRVEEGEEGVEPYPGLSAFTEENAERFFGREAEVEAFLRKLGRARLLAIAGPSGAGKTSFVQAGVIPALPEGWGHVVVQPGDRPFETVAQSFRGGGHGVRPRNPPEKQRGIPRGERARNDLVDAVRRWREDHEQALLVFDQFEELFTLNAPEVQGAFAELLGRLPLEADAHVLLCMRDDFLIRCREHEALAPGLAELTLLVHPTGAALRRALVQPALSCGYRFEDEALVEAMLGQVEHERGALPLLAFAAARLWDKRDRDEGTLTRGAYEEIGGVGGALAHHAEETLERIGASGAPIVRELFRNLVTAEGTRAARERNELLSVFQETGRDSAATVLEALIDARLLTSYEVRASGSVLERPEAHSRTTVPLSSSSSAGPSAVRQRVEIIHESLLSAWPRLVRWQTQDADAAQLRDQLRQAAQAWDERGRSPDLLWAGSAYREFALWRDGYPGRLSATEDAFARAMETQADRSRNRRRIAGVSLVAAVSLVAVTFALLWRGSEEARRGAEAADLLSLGRLRLEGDPSAALAFAIRSLERADSEAAREFAIETLWRSPVAFQMSDETAAVYPTWSPDGRWLGLGGVSGVVLVNETLTKRYPLEIGNSHVVGFSEDNSAFVTYGPLPEHRVWSLPALELLESWDAANAVGGELRDRTLLSIHRDPEGPPGRPVLARLQSIGGGAVETLGHWPTGVTDPDLRWLLSVEEGRIVRRRLSELDAAPVLLGRHDGRVVVRWAPWRDRFVTADDSGEVRVWDARSGALMRTLRSPAGARAVALDRKGRYVAAAPAGGPLPPGSLVIFDLDAPIGAAPIELRAEVGWLNDMQFHPDGTVLATGNYPNGVFLWNLSSKRAITLRDPDAGAFSGAVFTPEGRLVSRSDRGVLKLWSLWEGSDGPRTMFTPKRPDLISLAVTGDGGALVVLERTTLSLSVVQMDGTQVVTHKLSPANNIPSFSLSPDGARVAYPYVVQGRNGESSIRIVELATGEETVLPRPRTASKCRADGQTAGRVGTPLWLPDGRLVSDGGFGLRLWDLETRSSRKLLDCRESTEPHRLEATPDSKTVLTLAEPTPRDGLESTLLAFDLESGEAREVTEHGRGLSAFSLDATGRILVTGDANGVVRVSFLAGGEPHLLLGHSGLVWDVGVSPDGRWVVSAGQDGAIRLWPMPDLSQPPLHTLPLGELLAKLGSLTNLRVVAAPESATGYDIEPGPFRGWAEVPTW
jgi:WD40 repeat protein